MEKLEIIKLILTILIPFLGTCFIFWLGLLYNNHKNDDELMDTFIKNGYLYLSTNGNPVFTLYNPTTYMWNLQNIRNKFLITTVFPGLMQNEYSSLENEAPVYPNTSRALLTINLPITATQQSFDTIIITAFLYKGYFNLKNKETKTVIMIYKFNNEYINITGYNYPKFTCVDCIFAASKLKQEYITLKKWIQDHRVNKCWK